MTQSIFCAGALALAGLSLGCSSSSSSPAAGPADASTGGQDATGGSDASSGADTSSPSDAAAADDIPPIDAGAIVAARPYSMHAPTGYDPSKPTPLVVMFHGAGVIGDVEEALMQLTAASDAHGFLYAYGNGTLSKPPDGGLGTTFWNATNACCDFYDSGVNDVEYFDAIVDDVESKYNVDHKQVYVVGHSNGGFMGHRLACDRASRVAAVVSLAGAQWYDLTECSPSGHVSVVEVHGDVDHTIWYDGGISQGGLYPSAPVTATDWGTKNGCTGALTDTGQTYDLVSDLPGNETQVSAYQGCPSGIDVELWTVQGGVHIPNLNHPTWGDTVWAFLSAHPKK